MAGHQRFLASFVKHFREVDTEGRGTRCVTAASPLLNRCVTAAIPRRRLRGQRCPGRAAPRGVSTSPTHHPQPHHPPPTTTPPIAHHPPFPISCLTRHPLAAPLQARSTRARSASSSDVSRLPRTKLRFVDSSTPSTRITANSSLSQIAWQHSPLSSSPCSIRAASNGASRRVTARHGASRRVTARHGASRHATEGLPGTACDVATPEPTST